MSINLTIRVKGKFVFTFRVALEKDNRHSAK